MYPEEQEWTWEFFKSECWECCKLTWKLLHAVGVYIKFAPFFPWFF